MRRSSAIKKTATGYVPVKVGSGGIVLVDKKACPNHEVAPKFDELRFSCHSGSANPPPCKGFKSVDLHEMAVVCAFAKGEMKLGPKENPEAIGILKESCLSSSWDTKKKDTCERIASTLDQAGEFSLAKRVRSLIPGT